MLRVILNVNRVSTFSTIVINVFHMLSTITTRHSQRTYAFLAREHKTHIRVQIKSGIYVCGFIYLGPLPMILILSFHTLCTVNFSHSYKPSYSYESLTKIIYEQNHFMKSTSYNHEIFGISIFNNMVYTVVFSIPAGVIGIFH